MTNAQPPADQNLVQCEITKQWAPADEITEVRGYKVCNAGKEILLQRLKSGEPLPGEMKRPSAWCRFGCIFLDGILLSIPVFAIQYLAGMLTWPPNPNPDVSLTMKVVVSAWGLGLALVYFGTMDGAKGQPLGKMAGKLKVVNLDGTPITMSKAYLRTLCYRGPSLLMPLVILAGSKLGARIIGFAVAAYVIVNIIMALADRNMQRVVHDRLTGTRVIDLD